MDGVNQEQYTMMRAAYGDSPAALIASGGYGTAAGYPAGEQYYTNPLAEIGSRIRPVVYTPPARVNVGYYGMYQMPTGVVDTSMAALGFPVPRSIYSLDFQRRAVADLGERIGSGIVGAGLAAGGMIAGTALGAYGGIAGSLVGGTIGMGAAAMVQDAVNQRREMMGFLESASYRFIGAGNAMMDPRMGRGMSLGARRDITEYIRSQEIKDPFLSMDDMSSILKQGVTSNLFVGTRDVDDFKRKFKEVTDAVRLVTRTLNTTLEEGMKVLKDLRNIGVEPLQARGIVTSAEALGRVAGRTGTEMLNIALQGAETFRGTGVTMGIGAQATMMNLANIRALRDAGLLSTEAIAQAGGEEQMAMQGNIRSMAFAQSPTGRGMNAAFWTPGVGFNAQAFQQNLLSGGGNLFGLAMQAASNLSSPKAMIEYQANQAQMISEMGKTFGNQGLQMGMIGNLSAQAKMLMQTTGVGGESAFRFSAQQAGISEPEITKMLADMKGAGFEYAAQQSGLTEQRRRHEYELTRMNTPFWRMYAGAKEAIGTAVDTLARPTSRYIDDVRESIDRMWEKHFLGYERVSVGRIDLTDFRSSRVLTEPEKMEEAKARRRLLGTPDLVGAGGEDIAEKLQLLEFRAPTREPDRRGMFGKVTGGILDLMIAPGKFIYEAGPEAERGGVIERMGAGALAGVTPAVMTKREAAERGRIILKSADESPWYYAPIKFMSKQIMGYEEEFITIGREDLKKFEEKNRDRVTVERAEALKKTPGYKEVLSRARTMGELQASGDYSAFVGGMGDIDLEDARSRLFKGTRRIGAPETDIEKKKRQELETAVTINILKEQNTGAAAELAKMDQVYKDLGKVDIEATKSQLSNVLAKKKAIEKDLQSVAGSDTVLDDETKKMMASYYFLFREGRTKEADAVKTKAQLRFREKNENVPTREIDSIFSKLISKEQSWSDYIRSYNVAGELDRKIGLKTYEEGLSANLAVVENTFSDKERALDVKGRLLSLAAAETPEEYLQRLPGEKETDLRRLIRTTGARGIRALDIGKGLKDIANVTTYEGAREIASSLGVFKKEELDKLVPDLRGAIDPALIPQIQKDAFAKYRQQAGIAGAETALGMKGQVGDVAGASAETKAVEALDTQMRINMTTLSALLGLARALNIKV